MGSGHFLVRACQYLAEEIATNPCSSDPNDIGEQPVLTYWKRKIAEHCLFGVDLNPLAVELAKLSLWLETVSTDKPLAFLDHHLRSGNSLVGANLGVLGHLHGTPSLLSAVLAEEFGNRRDQLIGLRDQIENLESSTMTAVRGKVRLVRRHRSMLEPFLLLADTWCSDFFSCEKDTPSAEQYNQLIRELHHPRRFKEIILNELHELVTSVRNDVSPFHWDLEFPDVFLGPRS